MYISKTFFKQNQKVSILNNIAEFFLVKQKLCTTEKFQFDIYNMDGENYPIDFALFFSTAQ